MYSFPGFVAEKTCITSLDGFDQCTPQDKQNPSRREFKPCQSSTLHYEFLEWPEYRLDSFDSQFRKTTYALATLTNHQRRQSITPSTPNIFQFTKMVFGEPHTHFIYFRECGHIDPKYIFVPDPKDAEHCICGRSDKFKIRIDFSGQVIYHQQARELPARCDNCSLRPKMKLEEYEAYLSLVPGDEVPPGADAEDETPPVNPPKRRKV
ncbi:hypothetical protein TWF730_003513 [Orbilia blumenaviensis]|uniref:Uncharacterized protein n=1 Tax=Orbilia blumenaviensis TaxID=1796055 RepID=A0AAV9U3V2_9PEZI